MRMLILCFLLTIPQLGWSAPPPALLVDLTVECLLGASAGKVWMGAEKARASVKPGETFRVYGVDRGVGVAKNGPLESFGEPCPETWSVPFPSLPEGGAQRLAIRGSWEALPRPVQRLSNSKIYTDVVRQFLQQRGMANPTLAVDQLFRLDLEGDGVEEVLISATHFTRLGGKDPHIPTRAKSGDYSVVLLRRIDRQGKVVTLPVTESLYPACATEVGAGDCMPWVHRISSIADANGDGVLEVVLRSSYYEGNSATLFEWHKEAFHPRLDCGCGA